MMSRREDMLVVRNLQFLRDDREKNRKSDHEKFAFDLRKKKQRDFIQMLRMKNLKEGKKDSELDSNDFSRILRNVKSFGYHESVLNEIRRLEEFVAEFKDFQYDVELKDEDILMLMDLFKNNFLGSLSLILSIFTNLFLYSREIIDRFLQMNGMKLLIECWVDSKFDSTRCFVLDAISNILNEVPERTQEFLTIELVKLLDLNLKSQSLELKKSTETVLCHIFNYREPVPKEISLIFIRTISFLIDSDSSESNIYWVLFYLLKNSQFHSEQVHELSLFRVIIRNLSNKKEFISIPCKRIIETVVLQSFLMSKKLIELGLLDFFLGVLKNFDNNLIDFVVKIYSNLLLYHEFIHDELVDDALFCRYIDLMTDQNLTVRKEVIHGVHRLMKKQNYKIINDLINLNLLTKIAINLELKERDIIRLILKIAYVFFDIIHEICNYDQIDFYTRQFYESGAVELTRYWLIDVNSEVSRLARKLIDSFFQADEE